jgi:methylglutaconyl-CoA hydratase
MLTGRRIDGKEAESFRLVNKSLPTKDLETYLQSVTDLLITSGPKAISYCKNLIFKISNLLDLDQALKETAKMIAEIRISEEGQEGMKAFLEKRQPSWIKK